MRKGRKKTISKEIGKGVKTSSKEMAAENIWPDERQKQELLFFVKNPKYLNHKTCINQPLSSEVQKKI